MPIISDLMDASLYGILKYRVLKHLLQETIHTYIYDSDRRYTLIHVQLCQDYHIKLLRKFNIYRSICAIFIRLDVGVFKHKIEIHQVKKFKDVISNLKGFFYFILT